MNQAWTWHNDKLEPGNCFVEFKVDTPHFGGLSIDRFQLPNTTCDEIQATGKIRWQGNTYKIWPDRTADLRKLSAPHARPIIIFITEMLEPLPEHVPTSTSSEEVCQVTDLHGTRCNYATHKGRHSFGFLYHAALGSMLGCLRGDHDGECHEAEMLGYKGWLA